MLFPVPVVGHRNFRPILPTMSKNVKDWTEFKLAQAKYFNEVKLSQQLFTLKRYLIVRTIRENFGQP